MTKMTTIAIKTLLLMVVAIIIAVSTEEEHRCKYMTLSKVYCMNVGLKDIPQHLKKGVEMLNVRENRIGKLKNNSFERYPDLKELHLRDNGLAVIEHATFEPIQRLEILDLCDNKLEEVPSNIFALPELRKLFLDINDIKDGALDFIDNTAPIELLDLSVNKLTRMPRIKNLVDLAKLNVSINFIKNLTVDDLAPLCSLKELYVNRNPIIFDDENCECWLLDKWLKARNIKLDSLLNCLESSRIRCSTSVFSNHTLGLYEDCLSTLRYRTALRQNILHLWYFWLIVVVIVVAVASIVCYVICRKKIAKKSKERAKIVITSPSSIEDLEKS